MWMQKYKQENMIFRSPVHVDGWLAQKINSTECSCANKTDHGHCRRFRFVLKIKSDWLSTLLLLLCSWSCVLVLFWHGCMMLAFSTLPNWDFRGDLMESGTFMLCLCTALMLEGMSFFISCDRSTCIPAQLWLHAVLWWHQPIYQLLAMVTFSATILNHYAAWSMTSHTCLDQDDEINHLHCQWNLISNLTEMCFIWDSSSQDFFHGEWKDCWETHCKSDFSV